MKRTTGPASAGRRKTRIIAIAIAAAAAIGTGAFGVSQASAETQAKPKGVDVSGHQGSVDWKAVAGAGYSFAYVKATEGTSYESPDFAQQYNGSYDAGMIRGAYHFALPDKSSGAAQAKHFLKNGGGWSNDGKTLPGVLDIEWNPYGGTCYGKSQGDMVAWIKDFAKTYKADTGRDPVIYTAASWWDQCTGGSGAVAKGSPAWVAHYDVDSPAVPGGFPTWTIWQHSSKGSVPGIKGNADVNKFNGSADRLKALAKGK